LGRIKDFRARKNLLHTLCYGNVADFCLISRRTLDEFKYSVLHFHCLLVADWNYAAGN